MNWQEELAAREREHIDELLELLRMPSVSTAPEHNDDMQATAG